MTNEAGRPPKFNNPEELIDLAEKYFAECEAKEKPLTMVGLALALGFVSRQSIYDYEKNERFSYAIKKVRSFVESQWETRLAQGNCTGSIFWLKNHAGYEDRRQQDIGITDQLADVIQAARLRAKVAIGTGSDEE